MLEHFGVREENWRDAVKGEPDFIASETPFYVGRGVAALVADPEVSKKSGRVLSSWDLAEEYDFRDVDGQQPNWGRFCEEKYGKLYKKCDDAFYEYWFKGPLEVLYPDWP